MRILDEGGRVRADDVGAEDLGRALLGNDLREPCRVLHRPSVGDAGVLLGGLPRCHTLLLAPGFR